MRLSIIGFFVILVGGGLWLAIVPRLLPHLEFIPQTIYRHRIDADNEFRVFSEYSTVAGTVVYCEALRDGRPLVSPVWLWHNNKKPLSTLRFQTIVTADALAALVSEEHPLYILILVDLRTSETSRPRGDEGWHDDRYQKRVDRLITRFRASNRRGPIRM